MKIKLENIAMFIAGLAVAATGGYYFNRYFVKKEIIRLHGKEAWHDTATGAPKTAVYEALLENTWWLPLFLIIFGVLAMFAAFKKDKKK